MTAAWGPIISRHREETRAAFAASCGEQFEIESMSKHMTSKPASSSSHGDLTIDEDGLAGIFEVEGCNSSSSTSRPPRRREARPRVLG